MQTFSRRVVLVARGSWQFGVRSGFDSTVDYYSVLGVGKGASQEQVKAAFYSLAKKYHPDANSGFEGKFKEVNEAYRVRLVGIVC